MRNHRIFLPTANIAKNSETYCYLQDSPISWASTHASLLNSSSNSDYMNFKVPEKLNTIFTEIVRDLLPEVNPKKLFELSTIVMKKGRTQMYGPLTDALRKIQWVKLVGLKAIAIEKEIAVAMEPNTLVTDPLGQTAHSLCVTDCLVHTKSALDSMAVFLTSLLNLGAHGGDRDFKKERFRKLVAEKDPMLKHQIRKLRRWFRDLQMIRDEWIHRSSIRSRLIHGPSRVGLLPIPKKVMLSYDEQSKLAITEKNFWSTRDFVEYHYSNVVAMFHAIVERAIQIERRDLAEPPPTPAEADRLLFGFPIRPTEKMIAEKTKIKFRRSLVDW